MIGFRSAKDVGDSGSNDKNCAVGDLFHRVYTGDNIYDSYSLARNPLPASLREILRSLTIFFFSVFFLLFAIQFPTVNGRSCYRSSLSMPLLQYENRMKRYSIADESNILDFEVQILLINYFLAEVDAVVSTLRYFPLQNRCIFIPIFDVFCLFSDTNNLIPKLYRYSHSRL